MGFALCCSRWCHRSGLPMAERCMRPRGVEVPQHARSRCFSLSLSPWANAAPVYASLSRITTAHPTSGGHATLQSNVPRRVLPQCRGCGTHCSDRLVAECSAVCTGKSVSVFFASCRVAAARSRSLSLSLSLVSHLCVSVSAFVFLWHERSVAA